MKRYVAAGLISALLLGMLSGCQGVIVDAPPVKTGLVDDTTTYNQSSRQTIEFINNAIDTLLSKYVSPDRGLVDYAGIHADTLLPRVMDSIRGLDLSVLETSADTLAFWINAYNFTVIYHLQKDYQLRRQDEVEWTLFNRDVFRIGREVLTLDDLEKNNPLRIKKFAEPRTHFALVCAAMSCPPLLNRAYRGDRLWAQLDERTATFLNDSQFNPLPGVSALFDWYANDFTGSVRSRSAPSLIVRQTGGTVTDFVQSYLKPEKGQVGTLVPVTYDWAVNEWRR